MTTITNTPDPVLPSAATPTTDLLRRDVRTLDLSVRVLSVFHDAGIRTIGDLVKLDPHGLLRLRNFGKQNLKEVMTRLADAGLSLHNALLPIARPPSADVLIERLRAGSILIADASQLLDEAAESGPEGPFLHETCVQTSSMVLQALRILRGDSAEVQPPPPVPEVRVAP